jgi:molybdate/tungstate transport system substrate-binding protein
MVKRASRQYTVKLFWVIFTYIVLSGCNTTNTDPTDKSDIQQSEKHDKMETKRKNLHLLVSDALAGLFGKLNREFSKENPDIDISISTAPESLLGNKIQSGKGNIDFIAATDYKTLQEEVLVKKTGNFLTIFATDEIVIAWSKQSSLSDKITMDNWQWIFAHKEIVFGHSNSKSDVCGLRTTLLWGLADKYYRKKVNDQTFLEWMTSPLRKKIVRPSVLQLLPLLTTGTVDYVFIYRSLAEQHNLPYILLRPQINLGEWKYQKIYKKVRIDEQKGEVICFAFTIPKSAQNKTSSGKLGNFLLSDTGSKLLMESGLKNVSGGATMFTTGPIDIPIER